MFDNYNERLFNGKNLRSRLHLARFIWLQQKIQQYKCDTSRILELGCFDGKTLEFLDKLPQLYEGYDANWEGGLDIGREKWKNSPGISLKLCQELADFLPKQKYFDIAVCHETIEHLPLAHTEEYIKRLAEATRGYAFISVPNEKGIVFLMKHLYKFTAQRKEDREEYTWKEIFYSFTGDVSKVERHETGHKGFDYAELGKLLNNYFEVIEVTGIPFSSLPVSLNFTVGFVCKTKLNR